MTREYKRSLPHQTQTQILKTKQQTHEGFTPYRLPRTARCAQSDGRGWRGPRGSRLESLEFFSRTLYLFYLYTYLSHHCLRHISNSFTWTPPKRVPCAVLCGACPRPTGSSIRSLPGCIPFGRATETLAHSGCSDVPQRVTGSARPSAWHTAGRRACRRACTK